MLRKVEEWMKDNDMLQDNGSVIAAVSGGADSVCLLAILIRLSAEHGWKVSAFHLNHLIRGEEAERDESFVRDLCQRWQVKLTVVREDVPAFAGDNGLSLEEAGRICRMRALEDEARETEDIGRLPAGTVKIALAHHIDDNAETILHHLLRGSGLRGLAGIRPSQGRLIHPLLCVRRDEIRAFLTDNGIEWCEDSTNADTAYTRNRLRNEIIPLMEKDINPHSVENIVNAGRIIAEADDALHAVAEEVFRADGWSKDGEAAINIQAFLGQEPAVRSELIRVMLDEAAPGLKDITSGHFDSITDLARKETGKRVNLPGGVTAGRDYDILSIRLKKEQDPKEDSVWELSPDGGTAGGIRFDVFAREKGVEIPKNKWSKWFDYDKISGTLSVRTRREGDYLTLAGGVRKSLNRFFIDEKVPRDERDRISLLADGSHILWVVGMRISEYYKVTEETQRILQAEKKEG